MPLTWDSQRASLSYRLRNFALADEHTHRLCCEAAARIEELEHELEAQKRQSVDLVFHEATIAKLEQADEFTNMRSRAAWQKHYNEAKDEIGRLRATIAKLEAELNRATAIDRKLD